LLLGGQARAQRMKRESKEKARREPEGRRSEELVAALVWVGLTPRLSLQPCPGFRGARMVRADLRLRFRRSTLPS
jgi:hypothetical protein